MNGSAAAPAPDSLDLASLLCSRLCHDLLSPIGALANGLELLASEQDPDMRRRCLDLLEQSAQASSAKLQFFRVAFGAAGAPGEQLALDEARGLVEALAGDRGRVAVNWAIEGDSLPRPAVKTLLNLALIGFEALVRGGTLDIGAEQRDGASEIVVRAAGPRIAFDPAIGQALEGGLADGELSSRTAPATMLHRLAQGLDGELQYALSDEALVLGAVLPTS